MSESPPKLARKGEKLAARFLRKCGYRLLARNYRCPAGEIDIIALDAETLVFVEVKTRRSEAAADIEQAVTPAKQRQLARVARYYVHERGAEARPCRFDILAVLLPEGAKPVLRHIPDAFQV